MAKWSDFHKFVRPVVQGCPIVVVDNAIASACIEFCEKTMVWQRGRNCGDIVEGEQRYTYVDDDKQANIIQPLAVAITDANSNYKYTLARTNREDLDYGGVEWRFQEKEYPTGFFVEKPNYVILTAKPTKYIPNGLHMHVALKPKRDAEIIPDFIFEDWAETISDGALARLNAMSGSVWSKPEMVGYYTRRFRAGISRAKSKVMKSYVTQSKTMITKPL